MARKARKVRTQRVGGLILPSFDQAQRPTEAELARLTSGFRSNANDVLASCATLFFAWPARHYSKNDACLGPLAARFAACSSGVVVRWRGGRVAFCATAASRSVTMRSQI